MDQLKSLFNQYYNELTDNEISIFEYILTNSEEVSRLSINSLAAATLTSRSSVLRLTQKIGFSGYSEFKYYINNLIENREANLINTSNQEDLAATSKLFEQLDVVPIIEAIIAAPRVFAYGTGTGQRNVVSEFKRSLIICEKFITEIHAPKELELALSAVQPGDVVIVVSLSGQVREIASTLRLFKSKGVILISVTQLQTNILASIADYSLYYQTTSRSYRSRDVVSFVPIHFVMDLLFSDYLEYFKTREFLMD